MSTIDSILDNARCASQKLSMASDRDVSKLLCFIADKLTDRTQELLEANQKDMSRLLPGHPMADRLLLTRDRIDAIAQDMRNVAALPSPKGRVIEARRLPSGLELNKVSVPFGVVGVIYEARPNVTFDVTALCLKSGNACVLKGGSDAKETNKTAISIIHSAIETYGNKSIPLVTVTLLEGGHEATEKLLAARGKVDLVIPRGSRRLIDRVRELARVPVIETGAGVCHTYIHSDADIEMSAAIVDNGKTRRTSVCNALDCVLVDRKLLPRLGEIFAPLAAKKVQVYANPEAYAALVAQHYPAEILHEADESTFGTEFLSMSLAVKTVDGLDQAIRHINEYGSGHSDSIVTRDHDAAHKFTTLVDSACVYINAPTSWTDGAQFGLGCEIGISTQKLHARGPMGLSELNTYKWIIRGNGECRP